MKKDWEVKKLGEVTEIVCGGTPDTKVPEYWDGEYLWITPKDMGKLESIYVDDTERKISSAGLNNSSAKMLPPHSIILSTRAPIGHLAINTKEIATNQGCKGIVPNKELSTPFLFYFLKNSIELLNNLGSGTTFKELSTTKLAEVTLLLPPLPEQQHIVAILDEAFDSIAKAKINAEKNLQNARELFESFLQDIFANPGNGWEEKKLGEVCKQITSSKRVMKSEYVKDGVPFYRSKEIILKSKNLALDEIYNISENSYLEFKKKFGSPKENDILITAVGTVGIPYLVENEEFYFKDGNLLWLRDLDSSICPKYLIFYFRSNSFKEYLKKLAKGSSQLALTIEKLEGIIVPFPSLPEQQHIVASLDALAVETKKLEGIYQKKLADLDEMKKSILQKAFSGELPEAQ